MLEIKLECGRGCKTVLTLEKSDSVDELWKHLELKGFSKANFYLLQNGRPLNTFETFLSTQATLIPRCLGGKGGFGSMLRAIGAQIEKTTNREACRDLSGRRLRDINEEKRLKTWIENQANRKEEQAERKKKKLERLCAEPKHEFKDKNYEHERSILTERVDDAVEQGFKTAAAASTSVVEGKKNDRDKGVKRKTLLDEFDEIDSDELSSSEDDESSEPSKKIIKTTVKTSEDSGCSSSVEDHSESSCDKNLAEEEKGTKVSKNDNVRESE
ncbi:splicing regulator SDE2 [Diachasmimorpha longicaudata]|uniref:splicing regulator SDE2 n=1 Tax=Diachasmimorpha longicaudata TaxID=58733 RepID=UPI0030B878CB